MQDVTALSLSITDCGLFGAAASVPLGVTGVGAGASDLVKILHNTSWDLFDLLICG